MNRLFVFIILILLINCDNEAIVGSDDVTLINYVEFTNIEYLNNGTNLEVSGLVTNISQTKTISTHWFIECQFYANQDKILKLGGENTTINIPLDPGQQCNWLITWNPSNNSNISFFNANLTVSY